MATNLDRAQVVARHVQIQAVGLKSASVNSDFDQFDQPAEMKLNQSYRAQYEFHSLNHDRLDVIVELVFTAIGEETEGEAPMLLELNAAYRLVYQLANAKSYPVDALQHFAELNGTYNIWPYWRELVQTVTGRIGLASVVVPVFRPQVRQLSEDEEEQLQISLTGEGAQSN